MTEFAEQRLNVHYVVLESEPGHWQPDPTTASDHYFVYDASLHCEVVATIARKSLLIPDEGECDLCTASIGYVSTQPEESPHIVQYWRCTTAAWYGRHADVLLLCEGCSPHAIRDLFEERAKPKSVRAARGPQYGQGD